MLSCNKGTELGVTTTLVLTAPANSRAGPGQPGGRKLAGYGFVSLYVVLLVLFGAAPTIYALYLSFTTPGGKWAGLHNYFSSGHDFRFLPAFEHIAVYLLIWLVVLVVLVPFLALMLHGGIRRTVPFFRFVFYIPGAFVGSAGVVVWLLMLDPSVSPWHFVMSWFHLSSLYQTVAPAHLPAIFKGEDPEIEKLGYRAAFEVVPQMPRGRMITVKVPVFHGDLMIVHARAAEGRTLARQDAPAGVEWREQPAPSREVAVSPYLLAHFAPSDEGRSGILTLAFDPILWGVLMPTLRLLGL